MLVTWTDWDQDSACFGPLWCLHTRPRQSEGATSRKVRNCWRKISEASGMTIAGGRVWKCLGVFSCIFSHIGRTESYSAALWVERWAVKVRGSVLHLPDSLLLPTVKHAVSPASQASTPACCAGLLLTECDASAVLSTPGSGRRSRAFSDKTDFSDSFLYLRSVRLNRPFICDVISLSLFLLFCLICSQNKFLHVAAQYSSVCLLTRQLFWQTLFGRWYLSACVFGCCILQKASWAPLIFHSDPAQVPQ